MVIYMSLWNTFCKNLKYYRIKKLYSQEKLGELTDLSPRYISAIECGRYSPTIITIEKLAEALDIDAYILFKKNNDKIVQYIFDRYNKEFNCSFI